MRSTDNQLLPAVGAILVVMLALAAPRPAAANDYCGNGLCGPAETNAGCPQDCYCGDIVCKAGEENGANCPQDCCLGQDTCTSCVVNAPDEDLDGVPDQLEFDLAYKFFPHVKLQHQVADVDQTYAYRGLPLPFSVQPWSEQGACTEPFACLELRFGTPYVNDCGDNASTSCDGGYNHVGDSEFYAALVHRGAAWNDAQADEGSWFLLRDFTAAHWRDPGRLGISGESSRYGADGMCVPCGSYSVSLCNEQPGCFFNGLYCDYSEHLDGGAPFRCDELELQVQAPVLYSSEGKHALYHSDPECDDGGVKIFPFEGADECPTNAFDMKDYLVDGQLQNIGDLVNGAPLDTVIPAPELCSATHDIAVEQPFGGASSYHSHFTFEFDWSVPDNPCQAVQATGDSYYTDANCAGQEHQDQAAGDRRNWDGVGCTAEWSVPSTVSSRRDENGYCHNEAPQLVTTLTAVERDPLPSCSPCPEEYCEPATIEDYSYHRTSNCTGSEFYETAGFSSRGSWDGDGCVGSVLAHRTLGSYRDSDGYCHPLTTLQLDDMVRVYRDTTPPANCQACAETSCSAVSIAGDSLFLGAECSGAEYAGQTGSDDRQSWTGDGCSGNLLQTVAVTTRRDESGYCWPASSQQAVPVYRTTEPTLPTCADCEERSCTSVTSTGFSYFTGSGCSGAEYYDVNVGSATRRSWDGYGCAGDMVRGSVYMRSYRDFNNVCHNNLNQYVGGVVRIYRDDGPGDPSPSCKKCPNVEDGSGP